MSTQAAPNGDGLDIPEFLKVANRPPQEEESSTPVSATKKRIARPLHVLVPLIMEDLTEGKKAAERAGLPYYRAAGEKMMEAKAQLRHGEFQSWIQRNFGISASHARKYMQLAKTNENDFAKSFSTLSDLVRQTSSPSYNKPRVECLRERAEAVQRGFAEAAQQREALRRVAHQLIDAGFKVLALKHHPDKGGTHEEMALLNRARDKLKHSI